MFVFCLVFCYQARQTPGAKFGTGGALAAQPPFWPLRKNLKNKNSRANFCFSNFFLMANIVSSESQTLGSIEIRRSRESSVARCYSLCIPVDPDACVWPRHQYWSPYQASIPVRITVEQYGHFPVSVNILLSPQPDSGHGKNTGFWKAIVPCF